MSIYLSKVISDLTFRVMSSFGVPGTRDEREGQPRLSTVISRSGLLALPSTQGLNPCSAGIPDTSSS